MLALTLGFVGHVIAATDSNSKEIDTGPRVGGAGEHKKQPRYCSKTNSEKSTSLRAQRFSTLIQRVYVVHAVVKASTMADGRDDASDLDLLYAID